MLWFSFFPVSQPISNEKCEPVRTWLAPTARLGIATVGYFIMVWALICKLRSDVSAQHSP